MAVFFTQAQRRILPDAAYRTFIKHAARKLSRTWACRQEMKRRSSVSVFVCLWQNVWVYGLERSLPGRCTVHAPLGLGTPPA